MQAALASELVVQTLRTTNVFLRTSRRLFRPHGLTEAQFNVLNLLAEHEAGLSQRELSDFLVVDRSNVTGLLDRMETLAWIVREDVPHDRRAWRVRVSAKGRRLWETVYPLYERAVLATVGVLRVDEARSVLAAMRSLVRRAEELPGEMRDE